VSTDGQFNPTCAASNFVGSTGPPPGCNSQDATSGVATPAKLTLSGGTLVGTFTATCGGATDVAGNTAARPAEATYRVIYAFRGFFGIRNPPSFQKLKAGRSTNLRFTLGGDFGLGVVRAVESRQVNCSSGAALGALSAAPLSGLSFSSGEYRYSWSTLRSWKKTCREVIVTLDDGTAHAARFKLKI
jgi:hypothetical protein